MENAVRKISLSFFSIIIFLSNLIPIFGPSMASSGIGYNEKRFKKLYGINRRLLIISILSGNLLFSLIFWLIISYGVKFEYLFCLWLIAGTLLLNCFFSIIGYYIGGKRYGRKN